MLTKSRYFIKAVGLSLMLFTSLAVWGQENTVDKKTIPMDKAIQLLLRLQPAPGSGPDKQYGFAVEEVEAVFPELVTRTTENYMFGKNTYRTRVVKTVDVQRLIPILVAAVKEQQGEIEQLKRAVEVLNNKQVTAVK